MENSGNIEFKKSTDKDIPALKKLIQKLYEHENIVYSEDNVQNSLHKLITEDRFGSAWLIHFNNNIAGYLIITNSFSIEFNGETIFIDELFIDDNFRGKGFGRRAVKFAEEFGRSKGYHAIRLEAELNNESAHNLYIKTGFNAHERYIMTKWLK